MAIKKEQFLAFVEHHGVPNYSNSAEDVWAGYEKAMNLGPKKYIVFLSYQGDGSRYEFVRDDEDMRDLVYDLVGGELAGWTIRRVLDVESGVPRSWVLEFRLLPDVDEEAKDEDKGLWYYEAPQPTGWDEG